MNNYNMSKTKIFSLLIITIVLFINGICARSFWSDPLTSVKYRIESNINLGIDEISKSLNDTNNQINDISEKLVLASEKYARKVYDKVVILLDKSIRKLNKLLTFDGDNYNASDIDYTECKRISETINASTMVAYSNMSYCVVEKIERCDGYGESIKKIRRDILANFTMIKEDVKHCSDKMDHSIKSKAKAIWCLNRVGAKATWITINGVPKFVSKMTSLISKMTALHLALPYCAISHGINDLSRVYTSIYDETKHCIEEKRMMSSNTVNV